MTDVTNETTDPAPVDPIEVAQNAAAPADGSTPAPGSTEAADLNATSTGTVEASNDLEKAPDPGAVNSVDQDHPEGQEHFQYPGSQNDAQAQAAANEDTVAAPELEPGTSLHAKHGVAAGPKHTQHSQHSAHHKHTA